MPPEWLCQFLVVNLDVLFNRGLQFTNAGENASIKCTPFQLTKPPLNGIQPRCARRRKMQFEARVLGQPGFDLRGFVSRAIIQNHVQIQILWGFPVDLPQKIQKLLGAMALSHATNHLARQNVKSRVQAGCTMALIIVRLTFNLGF